MQFYRILSTAYKEGVKPQLEFCFTFKKVCGAISYFINDYFIESPHDSLF